MLKEIQETQIPDKPEEDKKTQHEDTPFFKVRSELKRKAQVLVEQVGEMLDHKWLDRAKAPEVLEGIVDTYQMDHINKDVFDNFINKFRTMFPELVQ
eukprot:3712616-Karenia_brevis.AAC.1